MKITKRVLALILATLMVFALAACGGGSGGGGGSSKGTVTVDVMYGGESSLTEMYNLAIDQFNKTYGKENKIRAKGIPKSSSINTILSQQLPNDTAPDVLVLSDDYFKRYTTYLEDLSGVIDSATLDALYPNTVSRYHYNTETTTSNDSDPLYGIPSYSDTTVLYYNKTVLEKNGVKCISVDPENLADFNAGNAKDLNGKTKSDYGIKTNVPAKGFYRSATPFVPEKDETDGSSWALPDTDEELVFNDRIAMNWDEIEDLGLLCTKTANPKSASQYGYYTEWWFNYGFSVGGDCIEDLSGKGDWTFTLASDVPNYIVGEGKTYTGVYTGTQYKAGDTLDFKDIINAKQGDTISYATDSKTYYNFTVNGANATLRDLSAQVKDGTLTQLPSIREAFTRFCYLAGVGGLNVCPYPTAFNGTTSVQYFATGSIALLVERISYSKSLSKIMKDNWGVAPMPQYKVYSKPTDPQNDTVVKAGKSVGHSLGYAMCVKKTSTVMDEANAFVKWFATDGQKFLAEKGYVSTRKDDAELFMKNSSYSNSKIVINALEVAEPGDWWYLLDNNWIDTWANPLNKQVRYGKMSLSDYLYAYIEKSNQRLKDYK